MIEVLCKMAQSETDCTVENVSADFGIHCQMGAASFKVGE